MKNIVLFASGSGSNAENIIRHFAQNAHARVVAVFCNKPDAFVLERAKNHGIPSVVFTKDDLWGDHVALQLQAFRPDLIVLCGFLLQFPPALVAQYPNRIINIHPALLPKYGGKGMYGMHVHRAIKENNEPYSGISIHYVNEHYDEGAMIFQQRVAIDAQDTPETIAAKVQQLEHEHFAAVIATLLT